MIKCDECNKEVNKRAFCCDACRKRFARKALKGIVVVRQDGHIQDKQSVEADTIEPEYVYDDSE